MPTVEPVLSILVPSIPSRLECYTLNLLERIEGQVGQLPVEVLCLIDNKKRSIGLKREALVQSARGKFVAFVDDDDEISNDYVDRLVTAINEAPDADCIVFDTTCTLNDMPTVIVKHGIEYENTEVNANGATRKPWCCNAYSRAIAQSCHFPDASYGEDWYWVRQAYPQVKKQHRINATLYHYVFKQSVTEAELTYPPNDHPPEKDNLPEYSATVLEAARVIRELHPHVNRLLDVGSNIGQWSRAFAQLDVDVTACDSPHMESHFIKTPGTVFRAVDLCLPLLLGSYDLVVCLEVAEHIPVQFADVLIDSLCYHANTVVFSAATPGQGGHGHVNEQPFEYWAAKFSARGFVPDISVRDRLPPLLPTYYRSNMAIFSRGVTV